REHPESKQPYLEPRKPATGTPRQRGSVSVPGVTEIRRWRAEAAPAVAEGTLPLEPRHPGSNRKVREPSFDSGIQYAALLARGPHPPATAVDRAPLPQRRR